jgi:hypothetical protein
MNNVWKLKSMIWIAFKVGRRFSCCDVQVVIKNKAVFFWHVKPHTCYTFRFFAWYHFQEALLSSLLATYGRTLLFQLFIVSSPL